MDDERIIELFFERSESAIDELDQKYGSLCKTVSKNVLGSEEDAREAVNDTYLAVWNKIPPERPENLLGYVLKIAKNRSLNILRSRSAKKRDSFYQVALDELEECLPSTSSVEAEIDFKELSEAVDSFLETLTTENRVIFLRRYWFSDSLKEIAKLTGLTEKTVSVRLVRIRKKLKDYLSERRFFV
ncbi:MAG: sigma-70 family RNA polymerase sigma factor [Oscillospiraceae bacterium]|nr:sigma-70 family RNA polymerase sigma factor [Ruminococcus sp.]MCD8345797.1 sigma-70 family RNA polymerase sigma factor [Oscillospiraceae bacterium]